MPKGAIQKRNQPTLKANLTGKLAMGPPVAVPERNVHVDDHYRRSPNWEGPAFGPQPAPEPGFEAAPAGPSSPYREEAGTQVDPIRLYSPYGNRFL